MTPCQIFRRPGCRRPVPCDVTGARVALLGATHDSVVRFSPTAPTMMMAMQGGGGPQGKMMENFADNLFEILEDMEIERDGSVAKMKLTMSDPFLS